MRPPSVRAVLAFLIAAAPAVRADPPAEKPGAEKDPDVTEVRAYPLTQEKVDQLAAANGALHKLTQADPALRKRLEDDDDSDQSIAQMTKNMETKYPQAAKAIRGAGLSVREFVVLELAFTNDLMIVGMKRQGTLKAYPRGAITAENAAFVEANYEKLKALADQFDDEADDGDDP